tara:strand:- start:58 stop:744 length:687 start_codon:yes stop_codon:yes gene_type:complete
MMDTSIAIERRAFIRSICCTTGLIGSTWFQSACEINPRDASISADPFDPILLELADGRVNIESPMLNLPVAYVSIAQKKIFVEYESRISVSVLLAAHISVSSGLWRIPLFGEDLEVPIDAGDPGREFAERDISEWSPGQLLQEGDYRVQRGSSVQREILLDCVPILPEKGWVSGGPWLTYQCSGIGEKLCREVFSPIGKGIRHDSKSYRTCAESGIAAEFVSWACPQD